MKLTTQLTLCYLAILMVACLLINDWRIILGVILFIWANNVADTVKDIKETTK
jgi:hypothetical protein